MGRFLNEQHGEGELFAFIFLAVIGLAGYGGYQLYANSDFASKANRPRVIEADGQTYVACRGAVRVSTEGGGLLGGGTDTFGLRFTDASGLAYELHGIHKVTLTDIPKWVDAPFPTNPSATDADGKPFLNGSIYKWSDGSQAKFNGGRWERVQVPNDVCSNK